MAVDSTTSARMRDDALRLFRFPDQRPVHFVGIAGAGMSALAELFVRRGFVVTGSDMSPAGNADLEALGVIVHRGHDAAFVVAARAIVASSAIAATHVELAAARELGIPIVRRAEALGAAVAGMRGLLIARPAKSARAALSACSTGAGQSATAISRPAAPRVSTSTRSNQHQPPASVNAPGGRAASVIAIGRKYSIRGWWRMPVPLARGQAYARSTGTRLPAGIATSP